MQHSLFFTTSQHDWAGPRQQRSSCSATSTHSLTTCGRHDRHRRRPVMEPEKQLHSLPPEILDIVAPYCHNDELDALSLTSRRLHNFVEPVATQIADVPQSTQEAKEQVGQGGRQIASQQLIASNITSPTATDDDLIRPQGTGNIF
ncbi:hypothetical protein CPLU01_15115 [Colletotrichum plurivorum]|uniref:F-box domain-containing protein n=1 Tax=Colletotrichum plurivorum TaxID=2175906 RepID=A0A8H6MX40_9PEZI|nr:hypothetical protein CPLU01_15115 [Colletotrichum plurivorum]